MLFTFPMAVIKYNSIFSTGGFAYRFGIFTDTLGTFIRNDVVMAA